MGGEVPEKSGAAMSAATAQVLMAKGPAALVLPAGSPVKGSAQGAIVKQGRETKPHAAARPRADAARRRFAGKPGRAGRRTFRTPAPRLLFERRGGRRPRGKRAEAAGGVGSWKRQKRHAKGGGGG